MVLVVITLPMAVASSQPMVVMVRASPVFPRVRASPGIRGPGRSRVVMVVVSMVVRIVVVVVPPMVMVMVVTPSQIDTRTSRRVVVVVWGWTILVHKVQHHILRGPAAHREPLPLRGRALKFALKIHIFRIGWSYIMTHIFNYLDIRFVGHGGSQSWW